MRWSYKTEHFSLKKEGLLGSAFLDEAEIEMALNEFGKVGWELVSFMEVSDGMIAIFKQPFSRNIKTVEDSPPITSATSVEPRPQEAVTTPPPKPKERVIPESDDNDVGDIKIF